jgi:hypothetical protein
LELYGFVNQLVELQTQPDGVELWKVCRRDISFATADISNILSLEESMRCFVIFLMAGTPWVSYFGLGYTVCKLPEM